MPSLPRIRARSRDIVREVVAPPAREPAELTANGLSWIHLDSPRTEEATALAERFGWHPLDVEDVLSKRQRPKVDEYEDYRFVVLHFPVYDKAAKRLNAGELDVFLGPDYLVTLPTVELLPVTRLFQRCADDEELRNNLFGKGSGYLLYHVLDDLFDYCFPILDKIGFKLDAAPAGAARRALPARGSRALLRRPRGRLGADLGHPRQLQRGRRGARDDERVGDLAPTERRAPGTDGLQRPAAAADAHRQRVRDERRVPRPWDGRGVLDPRRGDDRCVRRAARVLPPEALLLIAW